MNTQISFDDFYTDYLIVSNSSVTATELSRIHGTFTHDKVTQSLSKYIYDSKYLWNKVKTYITEVRQAKDIVTLSFDDSIQEKKSAKESELNTWHFDHCTNKSIKGVNFITGFVEANDMRLPCCAEFVKKDLLVKDTKTGKTKRKASVSKNELFRRMLGQCRYNFCFDYVLIDSWYSSVENMNFCKGLKINFIMSIKSNRKVCLSKEDKLNKKYTSIKELQPEQQPVEIWLEKLDFPLLLTKQVFKNGNGTVGELYLVCSDLNLSFSEISTIYKRRWDVEEYHKSIKSNTGFGKSQAKKIRTQTNHYMLSILAFVKLEWLKQRLKKNHFAIKSDLRLLASKVAIKLLWEYERKSA